MFDIAKYTTTSIDMALKNNYIETEKFLDSLYEACLNRYTSRPMVANRLLKDNPRIYKRLLTSIVMLNEFVPPTPYSSTVLTPNLTTLRISKSADELRIFYTEIFKNKFTSRQAKEFYHSQSKVVQLLVYLISNTSLEKIDKEWLYSNITGVYTKLSTNLPALRRLTMLNYQQEEDKGEVAIQNVRGFKLPFKDIFIVETPTKGYELLLAKLRKNKLVTTLPIQESLKVTIKDKLLASGGKTTICLLYKQLDQRAKVIPICEYVETADTEYAITEFPLKITLPKNVFREDKEVYKTPNNLLKKKLLDSKNMDDVHLISNKGFLKASNHKQIEIYTVSVKDFYVEDGVLKGVTYKTPSRTTYSLLKRSDRADPAVKKDEVFLCEVTDEMLEAGLTGISLVMSVYSYRVLGLYLVYAKPTRVTTNKSISCNICDGVFFDKSLEVKQVCNKCNSKLYEFISNFTEPEAILMSEEFVANKPCTDYTKCIVVDPAFRHSSGDNYRMHTSFNMLDYKVDVTSHFFNDSDARLKTIRLTKTKPVRAIQKPLPLYTSTFKFKVYNEKDLATVLSHPMLVNEKFGKWGSLPLKIGRKI